MRTQKEIRAAFWAEMSGTNGVSKRKISEYSGTGKMYDTDTRCAFVDWMDTQARAGLITQKQAENVTL